MIDQWLLALQMLVDGRVNRVTDGRVVFQRIARGLIFIHLPGQDYLYERRGRRYRLRAIP